MPAVGPVRRLQALAVEGWPLGELGSRLGVSNSAVGMLRVTRQERVLRVTAERVAVLFDVLWPLESPPAGRGSSYAATVAERRGWVAAWRWDGVDIDDPAAVPLPVVAGPDEVLVDRIVAGTHRVPATSGRACPELVEAIRRLAGSGLNDSQIGRRVGRSFAAVQKTRLRHGIPPGVACSAPQGSGRGADVAA